MESSPVLVVNNSPSTPRNLIMPIPRDFSKQFREATEAENRAAMLPFLGQKIVSITLDKVEERIKIDFGPLGILFIWDAGDDCCEQRYIQTDCDLAAFAGASFVGMKVNDMGGGPEPNTMMDEHEMQALNIHTNMGIVDFVTHNIHNGNYGGFFIRAWKAP